MYNKEAYMNQIGTGVQRGDFSFDKILLQLLLMWSMTFLEALRYSMTVFLHILLEYMRVERWFEFLVKCFIKNIFILMNPICSGWVKI